MQNHHQIRPFMQTSPIKTFHAKHYEVEASWNWTTFILNIKADIMKCDSQKYDEM